MQVNEYTEEIFPVNIYTFLLDNVKELNEDLLEEVYYIEKNEEDYKRSNRGGFHSNTDLNERNIKCFDALAEHIEKITGQIITQGNYKVSKECKLNNMWFIINRLNDYNITHSHARAFLSGAYYLKVPNNNKSDLMFQDPLSVRKHENITPNYYKKEVCENMLVLFPGWLGHKVPENTVDEDRIVISFNLTYPY